MRNYFSLHTFEFGGKRVFFHDSKQAFVGAGKVLKRKAVEDGIYDREITIWRENTKIMNKRSFIKWWNQGFIDFDIEDSHMVGTVVARKTTNPADPRLVVIPA